jgi:hypothetical protein
MLLNEKAVFYENKPNILIHLQANERLFLLSGSMSQYLDEVETIFDSIHFISRNCPSTYELNSSSIVYTWTDEDEIYYSNLKKFKVHFTTENKEMSSVEPFYPVYSGHIPSGLKLIMKSILQQNFLYNSYLIT